MFVNAIKINGMNVANINVKKEYLKLLLFQMWRTQKAYRLNLEKLTDEKIVKSKEMASKLQEPSISLLQVPILK